MMAGLTKPASLMRCVDDSDDTHFLVRGITYELVRDLGSIVYVRNVLGDVCWFAKSRFVPADGDVMAVEEEQE